MGMVRLNTDQLQAISSKVTELTNPTDVVLVELTEDFEDNEIILEVGGNGKTYVVSIDGFIGLCLDGDEDED